MSNKRKYDKEEDDEDLNLWTNAIKQNEKKSMMQ